MLEIIRGKNVALRERKGSVVGIVPRQDIALFDVPILKAIVNTI